MSSDFRRLSEWVQDALTALVQMPGQPTGDPRVDAALVAVAAWGRRRIEEAPISTNIAELAVNLGGRLEVMDVRPGAAATVHATDLHALPGEPPTLLRRPAFIIEVRRPDKGEALFGQTACLGGYHRDGTWFLVGLDLDGNATMARWTPRWTERELAEGVPAETDSPLVSDVSAHREWAMQAARFLVVLGLLLDAEGAPLREERETTEAPKLRGAPHPAGGWTTRHLYLDDRRSSSGGSGAGEPADLSDRADAEVPVRGHLKRQPHGPGLALRKWIWVAGYEARRWVGPRPRMTVVH